MFGESKRSGLDCCSKNEESIEKNVSPRSKNKTFFM